MKYTKLIARISALCVQYEHFESDKCIGCLSNSDNPNCDGCRVNTIMEQIAKDTVENIASEINEAL